jgi:hypothetical protein
LLGRPGVAHDDTELVAREVAELEAAARPTDGLDVGVPDVRDVRGVEVAHGEQLGGDGVAVLRPRPGHALAAHPGGVRERASEVVRVPASEGRAHHQPRVVARVRVHWLDVEGLDFGDAEVLGGVAEAAAGAVGVARVVLHADGAFEFVCLAHSSSTPGAGGLTRTVRRYC